MTSENSQARNSTLHTKDLILMTHISNSRKRIQFKIARYVATLESVSMYLMYKFRLWRELDLLAGNNRSDRIGGNMDANPNEPKLLLQAPSQRRW